jgi:hypothetical protein
MKCGIMSSRKKLEFLAQKYSNKKEEERSEGKFSQNTGLRGAGLRERSVLDYPVCLGY